MQWGQIKTIFIISFLVLNLFLVQQLIDKINQTNIDTIAKTTIEDQLKAEEITYALPERGQKAAYVSAQRYQLTEEDLNSLKEKLDREKVATNTSKEVVVSEFNEPLELDLESNFEQSISKIKDIVIYGDSYSFWEYYREENVLLFFQRQNNRTVYFNESGVLIVVLNDQGDAIQYRQTLLDEVELQSEEQTVIDPLNALEVLYSNNIFKPQDEITNMTIGYHTLVPLEDGVQVFVPTWEVTVNNEDSYFVNAIEGQYIPNDEEKFVMTLKEYLKRQIEELNRSETE